MSDGVSASGIAVFVGAFLAISAATALVSAAIRLEDVRHIVIDTSRFFVMIVAGITILCVVVVALEWMFIRPLL